jgi:hypothetical protein
MQRLSKSGLNIQQIKQRINDLAGRGKDPGFPAVRI